MSKQINIGGRLHSTEQGNVITGANEVLDDTKGKKQNVINADVDAELLRLDQSKQNNLTFDNTPTEDSNNPVKSSGVYAADKALSDAIEAILILIPSAATALNQLADKSFVNSSIATDTATFRGTSETGLSEAQFLEWANGLTHDMNDYVFWQTIDEAGNTLFKRYKWNGTQWLYEYTLNNSSFTADQWAAITSGITTALVEKLVGLPTNTALQQALNSKQDALTFDNVPTENSNNPVKSGGVYSAVKAEEDARLNLSQTVSEIGGDVSQIEDVIPAGATAQNKLVANSSMEAYVASIIQNITASFTLATTDGHINLTLTQVNGQVATITLSSSDIASAQALTALTGRVTTAEGNITSLTGRVSTNETDIANLQQLYNDLQQSKPEPVTALPETGQQQGVIYRLAGTTSYSDYMWNGSTWVLMATYNNAIDDVPTAGSDNLVKSGGVAKTLLPLDAASVYRWFNGDISDINTYDISKKSLLKAIKDIWVSNIGTNHFYDDSWYFKIGIFGVSTTTLQHNTRVWIGIYLTDGVNTTSEHLVSFVVQTLGIDFANGPVVLQIEKDGTIINVCIDLADFDFSALPSSTIDNFYLALNQGIEGGFTIRKTTKSFISEISDTHKKIGHDEMSSLKTIYGKIDSEDGKAISIDGSVISNPGTKVTGFIPVTPYLNGLMVENCYSDLPNNILSIAQYNNDMEFIGSLSTKTIESVSKDIAVGSDNQFIFRKQNINADVVTLQRLSPFTFVSSLDPQVMIVYDDESVAYDTFGLDEKTYTPSIGKKIKDFYLYVREVTTAGTANVLFSANEGSIAGLYNQTVNLSDYVGYIRITHQGTLKAYNPSNVIAEKVIPQSDGRYVNVYPLEFIKETMGMTSIVKRWGFIGDSLMSGFIAKSDSDYEQDYYHSYGQIICRASGAKGTNWSTGGVTAESWIEQYVTNANSGYTADGTPSIFNTDIKDAYIVCLGTNDTNNQVAVGTSADINISDYTQNANTFYGNLGQIIQRIIELNPDAVIFLCTIPNFFQGYAEEYGINTAIRTIANLFNNNVLLVDLQKYADKFYTQEFYDKYMSYGHLTLNGYQWMAYLMMTYIDYIINENPAKFKFFAYKKS